MKKKYEVEVTVMLNFEVDENSKVFKEALNSYRAMIGYEESTVEDMLEHTAFELVNVSALKTETLHEHLTVEGCGIVNGLTFGKFPEKEFFTTVITPPEIDCYAREITN